MPTIETEILRRYRDLQQVISDKIGDVPLFPKLGDVDAVDIASMICFTFSNSYPNGYRRIIDAMITLNRLEVTKEQVDEVYPNAEEFINWTIKTMRERQA